MGEDKNQEKEPLAGNKSKRLALAFGGLLHDIGKIIDRTAPSKEPDNEILRIVKEIKNEWEKNKNKFRYAHEFYGWLFFKKYLAGKVSSKLRGLIEKAFFHHSPRDDISKIYQCADIGSSSERVSPEQISAEGVYKSYKPLNSVFELVSIGRKISKENVGKKGYIPQPLDVNEDTPAKEWEELIFPTEYTNEKKTAQNPYNKLYTDFVNSLEFWLTNLPRNQKIKNLDEKILSRLYHLFYKYFWSVPSYTVVKRGKQHLTNVYSDISLFDHSRTVAALASALYTGYNLEKLTNTTCSEDIRKQLKLLLVEGDISGIQNFIFGLSNIDGVAKRLRARSFFLAILPELIARYILKKLDYPFINILYASAGKFQLLIGYEEGIENKLQKYEKEISELLLKNFGGQLSLVMAWEQFCLSELEKPTKKSKNVEKLSGYSNIVRRLHDKLSEKKKRKFSSVLTEVEEVFEKEYEEALNTSREKGTVLCRSCRNRFVPETGDETTEICEQCEAFKKLGERLTKNNVIAFYISDGEKNAKPVIWKNKDEVISKGFQITEDGTIGEKDEAGNYKGSKVILSFEVLDEDNLKDTVFNSADEILVFNSTDMDNPFGKTRRVSYVTGFRFVGNTVPLITEEDYGKHKTELADIEELKEHFESSKKPVVAPFEVIAKFAEGDERVGYMKLDVDNLGLVFMTGLKELPLGERNIELYTMSRIATLSRMLDLFFSGYINALLKEYKPEGWNGVESAIYTVFAGGDDLFVIGPWDKILQFASNLREKFGKYTCGNPDLGASAGIAFFKHNYPVRYASHVVDDEEGKAKKTLLDKLCELQKGKEKDCVELLDAFFFNRKSSLTYIKDKCTEQVKILEEKYGSLEEIKKNYTVPPYYYKKDKVVAFGEAFDWVTLKEIIEYGNELAEFIKNEKISRRVVYILYSLLKSVKEAKKDEKEKLQLKFYPTFYYILARNVTDKPCKDTGGENCQEFLEKIVINKKRDYELLLNFALAVFAYALMKTRRS